jgi:hypothetical protein
MFVIYWVRLVYKLWYWLDSDAELEKGRNEDDTKQEYRNPGS